jgi:hypothetical protein
MCCIPIFWNSSILSSYFSLVALLISRGGCSFEEKARIAMTFPNVAYAVIFDDRERSRLVPMSAGNAAGIDIGLMFIARESGLSECLISSLGVPVHDDPLPNCFRSELKKMIDQQARNATSNDVLLVSMDSVVPDYAYDQEYSDAQEWVLAAMSSFFAFLSCIGCLLVCAQAGFIPSENGRPAIFGGGELLLTEEEVLQLPVVDYDTRDDPTHQTSCAICLEDFEEGDKLRQLPCRHHFHTECVTPWLTERHSSCPLCKYQVNSIDDSETSLQSRWSAMFLYGSIVRMIPYNSRRTLVATDDLDQIRGENRADLPEGNFLDDGGAETV